MTAPPQTDAERARAAYAAYNARDVEAMLEYFHPEVEWHDDPSLPGAGVHRGHDGVVELLQMLDSVFGELTFDIQEIEELAGDGLLVSIRVVATGSSSGTPVEMAVAHLISLEDGLARRVRNFFDVEEARRVARSGSA